MRVSKRFTSQLNLSPLCTERALICWLNAPFQRLEKAKISSGSEVIKLKSEISQRLSNEEVQTLLQEKEESIKGLLQEGQLISVVVSVVFILVTKMLFVAPYRYL